MPLEFNRESMKNVLPFDTITWDEGGSDDTELELIDDLGAILLSCEWDITITNAASPFHHGVSELLTNIQATIDGGEERIRIDGYHAALHTAMYARTRPLNFIHGATGANQILPFSVLLPCQVASQRGSKINLHLDFGTEARLEETGANIVINSGSVQAYGIYADIKEETWLFNGSDNFGAADKNIRLSGDDKRSEQFSLAGDKELAANLYDVVDKISTKLKSKLLIDRLQKLGAAGYGWYLGAPLIRSENYLTAAYAAFQDDNISRGLMIPLPTAEITNDLLILLDRTTADNVSYALLVSKDVAAGGEVEVSKLAEPTSTKQPVN